MKRMLFLGAAALVLAGCEVGPDYKRPEISTPASYQEAAALGQIAPQEGDLSQYWTQFNDPELDSLIARALQSNLDLETAASRVREARGQVVVAGAALWPSLTASGNAINLHSNSNPLEKLGLGGSSGGGSSGPSSTNLHLYSAGFDASWELDIFGGARRGVEEAQANAQAAQWNLYGVEVTLTAEIANDYLALRATQARIAIAEGELKRQQDTLGLTSARARAGFVTQLDVNQQRSQAASTAAEIPPLQAQARVLIHALGVLLGEEPEALSAELSQSAPPPDIPPSLPVGLPSDLLRRRPDVREAERKLAAATANIGVQVANLYPKFNLLGLLSFAGPNVGSLFSSANMSTLGLGMIQWPLFEGGKLHANVGIANEEQQQAYYAYQQAVLKALQDVEDALARYVADQRRVKLLQTSVDSARSSAQIAEDQYRAGLVTFLDVLNAQSTLLQGEDELAQGRQALATDLASLYKALGGGWRKPPASGKGVNTDG